MTPAENRFLLYPVVEDSRLLVTENGHLGGIIALKDMMRFFSLKLDLEGEGTWN